MDVTRRDLVIGAAAAAAFPAACTAAAAAGGQFTPEAFGARGDGASDDYDAFQRLAAAVNAAGGGTVSLTPGRTYFLNRYKTPANGVTDVIFRGCSGLIVDGQGATIATRGDFLRDAPTTRGLSGLLFDDCTNVTVSDVQLVGNVQLTRRRAGLTEAPTHGLNFGSCSDVVVDGVTARHFAADGLYISGSPALDSGGRVRASRRFSVRNSRFLFNARQGMSVIQLRDGVFDNCDFSYTGYVDKQSAAGSYGNHAPSAGIDIEPDYTPFTPRRVDVLTGNIVLRNCRMIGNLGGALLAAQVSGAQSTIENIIVEACTLRTSRVSPSRYAMIFDAPGGRVSGCTMDVGDKTIFIGWYGQSGANPKFSGNTVFGTGTGPSRAVLIVRQTRGAPIVESNRFIVRGGSPPGARGQSIEVDNPVAVVRDNQVLSEG